MKPGGLGIQGQLGTHETEEGVEGPGKEAQLMFSVQAWKPEL